MFQKDMRISVLIDYYGALLSERKRYILELYYNNDFRLPKFPRTREFQDRVSGIPLKRVLLN